LLQKTYHNKFSYNTIRDIRVEMKGKKSQANVGDQTGANP